LASGNILNQISFDGKQEKRRVFFKFDSNHHPIVHASITWKNKNKKKCNLRLSGLKFVSENEIH
jgi:hypothetical protein